MSLSRDDVTISSYQVLLDIAGSIRELVSNPDALQKAAEAAYALPAKEQAKADQARADLKSMQDAIAEQKVLQADIEKREKALIEAGDALAIKENLLTAKAAKLNVDSSDLTKARAQLSADLQALNARDEATTQKENQLNQKSDALDARSDSLDNFEAELKERAAQFRTLTQGL